ncbi:hypothetical protein MYCTH_2313072 [Thermothelomyces thermophilus ATCC 42464]|uniref:DUF967 domain protein n=1 Tax=Thermothelomyces thermophilus (strain ATCC 42464 / BCRC 31852 / DSM 1799) TaxID=573729 RepID=G2QNM3_THET4|nr:uncharacterized protein MYCTH_2313072 [Thermothelomyces thermophilus ATCC 42464]AEO62096.1 hypothetical protein MYCTH_2313072 [Thermothelomyces thermophilus ATCC 42464]
MALEAPSTDPAVLIAQETSDEYTFRTFTTETAWTLGTALRARILSLPPDRRKPALISISLAGGGAVPAHIVFQCATEPGTVPDNEEWVRRKRNTVLRWGLSSWAMRMKTAAGLRAARAASGPSPTAGEIEEAFVSKYALASSSGGAVADDYAIHGGGFPVRVRGAGGAVVAVVVVSGLKQEDDHAVVAETVREVIATQG